MPCSFFLSSIFLLSFFFLFLAQSQRPQVGCLPYFDRRCGPSANLECRSEMCCWRLAANTRRKKSRQKSPSGHNRTTLSGYILLSSNISSTCPHNMVNFDPVADEIVSLLWGTPANFNGFRVFAALLHGTLVVGVSQTAAFNGGRHLYSAGRPSGWAFAHISSF